MKLQVVSILAIISLIAAVFVAGCASPTSNTSPTPSGAAGQHNAFLQKYLTTYQDVSKQNATINVWKVTWVNNSAANLQFALGNTSENSSEGTNANVSTNASIMHFASVQDATSYVNGLNKTGYDLVSSSYDASNATDIASAYAQTAGHAPTIDKVYEGGANESVSSAPYRTIEQVDDLVAIYAITLT